MPLAVVELTSAYLAVDVGRFVLARALAPSPRGLLRWPSLRARRQRRGCCHRPVGWWINGYGSQAGVTLCIPGATLAARTFGDGDGSDGGGSGTSSGHRPKSSARDDGKMCTQPCGDGRTPELVESFPHDGADEYREAAERAGLGDLLFGWGYSAHARHRSTRHARRDVCLSRTMPGAKTRDARRPERQQGGARHAPVDGARSPARTAE